MFECPKCGSKRVNSTNRFSAGIGAIIIAVVLFIVFSAMGAGSFAALISAGLFVLGIVSIGLGVFSGGTIFRCLDCSNKWTQG